MSRIVHVLFPLIGYLATATVMTVVLGVAYFWQTAQLTDDKMFRLLALFQGVDLQQIADAQHQSDDEVPPEEPSMQAVHGQQQMLDRNFEVKSLALQRGKQEYGRRLQQLKVQSERNDLLAREWEARFKLQDETLAQESLAKVVSDLEQIKAPIAKDELLLWIKDDRMDDVITMLGQISTRKKTKILQSFTTDEELETLYEIHRLILEKSTGKDELNQAQSELQSLNQ